MAFDTTPSPAQRQPAHDATMALRRPQLLVRAAARLARQYQRARDLPGTAPGQGGSCRARIAATLATAELALEQARRDRAPGYRPGQHVRVLGALIAESGAA